MNLFYRSVHSFGSGCRLSAKRTNACRSSKPENRIASSSPNQHLPTMQSSGRVRPVFNLCPPVRPAASTCSQCRAPIAQSQSTPPAPSGQPAHVRRPRSPSPQLLLAIALALFVSACPGALACQAGSSSRYARSPRAGRAAPPQPVHKLPPLSFGTTVCVL